MLKKEDYLCEVSWEVCNKVGGIYTVIASKAPYIAPKVENYILIGPNLSHHNYDFVEELPPYQLKAVFEEMKSMGLPCRYGKWMIKSEPKVILIDFSSLFSQKNEIKGYLWEKYKIDSLNTGFDYEEPLIFSVAAAKLIDSIQRKTGRKIVSQFHEWLAGSGLLWLKEKNSHVSTIFTTHATVLGRALASSDSYFYDKISNFNFENEAKNHGLVAKHQTEKASALNADVFTTVSEITSLEAQHVLGRKADVVLANGIDLQNFSSFEDLSIKHSELKHHIKDFIISYFFPHYSIELDNVLILFIFGRYEYENKGIDIFIESLGKLNDHLKKNNSDKTVVAFFYIPADTYGINHEVLENRIKLNDIKHLIDTERGKIIDHSFYNLVAQEKITQDNLFDKSFLDQMKIKMLSFKRKGNPPLTTHDLKYYEGDAIINGFKRANLSNDKSDKVKVMLYPAYLKSTDSLLGLDIYDAILGGHLGVFGSAYEPWGYTPLECSALGVASVTTDLSGFGLYIEKEVKKTNPGVFILKRFEKKKEEIVESLFQILKNYSELDKDGRIQNKIEARRIASLTDWKNLILNYFKAYDKACEKHH